MSDTTSVAAETAGEGSALAPINTGARGAMETLSASGKALAAQAKETAALARLIEGLEWGNVAGHSLSPATRYALAEFCRITRANPQLHVYVLGGRPYLNADYYADLVNQHPHFVRYEQNNLSLDYVKLLRTQAEGALDEVKRFGELLGPEKTDELRGDALRLLARAREIEEKRARYQPDPKATHVVETVIYRYENGAPLAAIAAGTVDREVWIKPVAECNWCGGIDKDPIGNADPGQTSRTRSFRRCARFAFSAWMENKEAEIARAERIIEAEFTVVENDGRAARALLPDSTGQAVRASGEPAASNSAGARDLPVEGELTTERPAAADAKRPSAADPPAGSFDHALALRGFFASLRDAGVSEDERKAWQKEHGLPASAKTWSAGDFAKAHAILAAPQRAEFERGCEMLGIEADEFASRHLGALPTTIRDYRTLNAALRREADGGEEMLPL